MLASTVPIEVTGNIRASLGPCNASHHGCSTLQSSRMAEPEIYVWRTQKMIKGQINFVMLTSLPLDDFLVDGRVEERLLHTWSLKNATRSYRNKVYRARLGCARFLASLIRETTAQEALAREINSYEDEDEHARLAEFCALYLPSVRECFVALEQRLEPTRGKTTVIPYALGRSLGSDPRWTPLSPGW